MHQGLWTHYQRVTDEFFTKMDHGKLIWKYRLMVFLAISFSFNCTGRSAPCSDCLLDRKTWNYVLTSWYFFFFLYFFEFFLFILLLKPSYMYKNITLKNCCVQIIPFIIMNKVLMRSKLNVYFYILDYMKSKFCKWEGSRQNGIKRATRVIGKRLHWYFFFKSTCI